MLVLSRKQDESIVIGKPGDVLLAPITITHVGERSAGVRLGIEAQRNIAIHRKEIVGQPHEDDITEDRLRSVGFDGTSAVLWHKDAGVNYVASNIILEGGKMLPHIKSMTQVLQLIDILVAK